ncbi:unnamed protein product [Mycena citricolor]|uniref:Transmembrane protein n=1 Tax=Mycena citricolor TaxID=2018698 RepID=A0AAD2HPJ9_9AGAR|nr:unnamed protein product [Mycena citricolor]CAK5277787.1 unnamed protein product [Mycena citricolor]CAK5277798.1 unnamed protein product [Mycena citricolor]
MFALRHFTSLLLLVSTAFVAASPTPLPEAGAVAVVEERNSGVDVVGIIVTLQASVAVVLPQINTLCAQGHATDLTVGPLIVELEAAIEIAVVALGTVSLSGVGSKSQCAGLLAEIIKDITYTIEGCKSAGTVLTLGTLIASLDQSLKVLLLGVELVLGGVLVLVGGLIVDVVVLLKSLLFGLTLGCLGL